MLISTKTNIFHLTTLSGLLGLRLFRTKFDQIWGLEHIHHNNMIKLFEFLSLVISGLADELHLVLI